MFDPSLISQASAHLPRMNEDICNGLSAIQVNRTLSTGRNAAEEYIHNVWTSAAASFPEQLKYTGCVRCTPLEEFKEVTKVTKPYRNFDLSRTDTYLMRYNFTFDGMSIRPRYTALTFLGDAGILFLKGTQYKVTPVVGGRVFNIEKERVYMPSPRALLQFAKTSCSFILNERLVHADAVSSPLYNVSREQSAKRRETLLIHYMLAEFGLTEVLSTFYNVNNAKYGIGNELDKLVHTGEWKVFRSKRLVPVGAKRNDYVPCEVRIAIPMAEYTTDLNGAMGGLFYVLDHWPEMMEVADLDDPEAWLRLLSRFIFKDADADVKLYEEMTTHRATIRKYMDVITLRQLKKEGINCNDIYDLFHYLNINLNEMLLHNDLGSLYNQELSTVKHLLYDIVYNIFTLMWDIQKLTGDRINADAITKRMDKLLRRDMVRGCNKHGEVSANSIAADCKPFDATCNMISQKKVSSAGRNSRGRVSNDEASLFHPSMVEVCSYQMMSKSDPTGRSKLNPFVYFGQPNYISRNPALVDYIDSLSKLSGR